MNLDVLKAHRFEPIVHAYEARDTILYALGLGYGSDPMAPEHLQFLYEDGLKMVPTMSVVLGHPGFWVKDPKFGIDWVKLLHGEQAIELLKPIPPKGRVRAESRVVGVEDKGAAKGAVMYTEKKLYDDATNELLASVTMSAFLRGDGGAGGFGVTFPVPDALPERAPDATVEIPTLPQIALIYRLSGDWNPIHASPEIARKAGFEKPILHGLCTMGLAGRALIQSCCGYDPSKLKSMFVRFSKPAYPGETFRTEIFNEGNQVRFRVRVVERDLVVLDRGLATFA
ncbi:MAG TPA: MaoC/PaaZ C-terminal domain-containing protein [Nevskiaceae bacterium]|nr:MaoC/PaaZ C-terminal domain-containing protein [Nevskiaceae bacterium]